jgi:osmotically-inducible protein OsmY
MFRILFIVLILSACSPVSLIMGAGAAVGTAATQERGVSGAASDTRIQAELSKAYLDDSFDTYRRIDMTVYGGRVMLTGFVPDAESRIAAIKKAWKIDGVVEVINELQTGGDQEMDTTAKDARITAVLRKDLTFASDIYAVNYGIDTIRGVIYLIGVAQDRAELDRVMYYAKRISGVKKVVSHVLIKGEKNVS